MPPEALGMEVGLQRAGRRSAACGGCSGRLRSIRPSLLDRRFRGDAWITLHDGDLTSLYLENSCLVQIRLVCIDVAALNGTLQQMRACRPSRPLVANPILPSIGPLH